MTKPSTSDLIVVRCRTCTIEPPPAVALLRARLAALNHAAPIAARCGVAFGAIMGELEAQRIAQQVADGTMRHARGLTPPALKVSSGGLTSPGMGR